jgi:hypothetical protein
MEELEIISALRPVIIVLEKYTIPYYVGGSIASSMHGIARATMDIDIVAGVKLQHVSFLKQELENFYYIDEDMIKEAIQNLSSFNLIHLESVIKIDVFILKDDDYQRSVIERSIKDKLVNDDLNSEFYFSSPEDIIINKLQWFERGGKVSERQWLDVIGVIKVQGDSLDKVYLQAWSKKFKILDLLKKAFNDAEIEI